MQKENFGLVETKSIKDTVIVLDASESALEFQESIVKTALQLIEKLPSGTIKGLYFLSNPRRYDPGKLSRNSAAWWEQNKLRGSFLTPVLEQIKESMVVVIGSGLVYDLEDWQENRWNSSLYFLNFKDTLKGNLKIGKEFQELSPISSCLYDPVISVEITGTGFMPFYWNNPEYRLSLSNQFKLMGSNSDDCSVSLGYFGSEVSSRVVRKSGEEETLELKSIDYQEQDTWDPLTETEAEIFHRAAMGKEFTCVVCGQNHPASRIRCDTNSILGEPIYPSLGKKRGFVLFKESSDRVLFKFHPVGVIKIEDLSVAVSLNSKEAYIYEFNKAENQWEKRLNFNNYFLSGDRRIVLI
jgi:hypothetical protein